MFNSTIVAVLITISAVIGLAGGYAISSTRSAVQIQRLSSNNAILSEANKKCAVDMNSVQDSVRALTHAAAQREKSAANAIKGAASAADAHTNRAKKIRNLSPVTPERQYEAIAREQAEYVQSRHHDQ
jgi:hypothetical protein